jgi:hypothetical protein
VNAKRTFLQKVLASGLENSTIKPPDVLKHADAHVLAFNLPNELKAKLLQASLEAEKMTPELVVETLGTVAMAANLPPHVLWNCIAEAAQKLLTGEIAEAKPAAAVDSPADPAPKVDATSKPNAKVKASAVSKAASGLGSSRRSDRSRDSIGSRAVTSPVVPGSEFEVDTDVGEDWGVDDIVEVVEEAEAVAAGPHDDALLDDWKSEEQTHTRRGRGNRKR